MWARITKLISQKELAHYQLTTEQLHQVAVENLSSTEKEIRLPPGEGIYFLRCDGDLEASLLLHEEIWDVVQEQIGGDVLASVPARNVLLISGTKKEQVSELKKKPAPRSSMSRVRSRSSYSALVRDVERVRGLIPSFPNGVWERGLRLPRLPLRPLRRCVKPFLSSHKPPIMRHCVNGRARPRTRRRGRYCGPSSALRAGREAVGHTPTWSRPEGSRHTTMSPGK